MSMFCDGLRSRIAVCDFFEVADFIDREVTKLVSENLFSDLYRTNIINVSSRNVNCQKVNKIIQVCKINQNSKHYLYVMSIDKTTRLVYHLYRKFSGWLGHNREPVVDNVTIVHPNCTAPVRRQPLLERMNQV